MLTTLPPEKIPYDKHFFDSHEDRALSSAAVTIPIVAEFVSFESVVDVGCGRGAWLKACLQNGADRVVGYDGDYVERSTLLIPPACFRSIDLSKPFRLDERCDLAMCLEVAEHLPQRVSKLLVETLCRAAPAVLFSAAIPGQGGKHHINEQWPDYWKDLFLAAGFRRFDCVRPRIWRDHRVAWWYRQNVYLFVSEDLVAEYPALQGCENNGGGQDLQLIAPRVLQRYTSFSGILREVPRSFVRAIRRRLV